MKWFKALFHVLFIFLISEILLWLIPVDTTSFYTPHPKYIYTHGSVKWLSRMMYDIATNQWMVFNQYGYRNPEIKNKTKYRILVYGDSILAAFHLSETETYPRQLEKLLNQSHPSNFEVINAGTCGYGPDQIFLRMQDEIPKFKPDFVIVNLFSFNDYGDLIRNKLVRIKPDGEIEWKTVKPARRIALSYWAEQIKWMRILLTIRYRHLSGYASTLEDELQQRLIEDQMYRTNPDFQERTDHYDFDLAALPDSRSSKLKIQLMQKVIQAISSYLRNERIPGLMVILPAIDDLELAATPKKLNLVKKYPLYSASRLTDIAQQAAITANLPFINIYPVFRKENPKSISASDWIHFNAQGCSIIAKTVYAYLQTQILNLPPSSGEK